jgi:hypothetical protein
MREGSKKRWPTWLDWALRVFYVAVIIFLISLLIPGVSVQRESGGAISENPIPG